MRSVSRFMKLSPLLLTLALTSCARDEGQYQAILEQNGRPRAMQKFNITSTAAVTALVTTTALDDVVKTVPNGATLALVSTQAAWFKLRTSTGAVAEVTDPTGAHPGMPLVANQPFLVIKQTADVAIDVKADTTSGSLAIYEQD
jgi:hypothetical protein